MNTGTVNVPCRSIYPVQIAKGKTSTRYSLVGAHAFVPVLAARSLQCTVPVLVSQSDEAKRFISPIIQRAVVLRSTHVSEVPLEWP